MAFKLLARTREKTTTVGTGNITVSGLVSSDNVLFSSGMSIGDTAFMVVVSGNGTDWEEFLGTYSAANTIQRTTTIRNNSGTTSHISLSGTSRVFAIGLPSDFTSFINQLGAGDATKFLRGDGTFAVPADSDTIANNTDVNISSPANYDLLQYETSDNKWHNVRNKYALGVFSGDGVLSNSQNLLYHKFSKAVTFPANFGSFQGHTSEATSVANPTSTTVINISKSTGGVFSNVGTITFHTGSPPSTTFATSGSPPASVSFGAGDVMRIQGPSSADATLAGVAITLVGYET